MGFHAISSFALKKTARSSFYFKSTFKSKLELELDEYEKMILKNRISLLITVFLIITVQYNLYACKSRDLC